MFGQFFAAMIAAVVVASLLGISLNAWIARGILYEKQYEEGNAVLRGVVDLITLNQMDIANSRIQATEYRKESLSHMTKLMGTFLAQLQGEVASGKLTQAQAKRMAIKELSPLSYGDGNYLFAIDSNYVTVVHPKPEMRVNSSRDLRDSDGVFMVRELVRVGKEADTNIGYVQYRYPRKNRTEPESKMSAVTYFRPWDWVIGTGVYLSDIEDAVKKRQLDAIAALRTRLASIRVGKTGYVYLFDESCNVIAHPLLQGKNFSNMRNPVSGASLCQELKEVAQRAAGENTLRYGWDRPNDPGHYVYEKISWVTREPATGWYVASSVYVDEIEAPLVRLGQSVIVSALATIALLGVAVFFLLRNLLRPIQDLSRVCRSIGQGDFSVRATEDAQGEMGFLCGQINGMADALGESRRREEERRQELAALNENLEREVENRTQDLSKKAAELEEANQRLLDLDRMKSSFLSSVSHELRTPLTSIMGFAKLINKDFDKLFLPLIGPEQKLRQRAERVGQNLGVIVREGERLTRLINDVLDLAKIESGRIEWRDSLVTVKELVEQSIQAVSGQFNNLPDVRLQVTIAPGLPPIMADRDRLTQVLINLLNNAAKFTPAGTVDVVAGLNSKGEIQFSVHDSGIGIPKEYLEKVFDKFQQVSSDTLSDKPQGTGLGLPISRQIVQHYGGRIWAESEPGQGSTFTFTLPASQGKETAEPAAPLVPAATEPLGTQPLILVVDDDPSVRSLLAQLLEDGGYRVLAATDGQEALEMARRHHPRLITMDLMMPGMNGQTAIAHLRKDPKLSTVPIVVISALNDGGKVASDARLKKPVDETLLLNSIRALLKSGLEDAQHCLVLQPAQEFFALPNQGQAQTVDEHALWQKLEAGFCGSVVVSHRVIQSELFGRLAGYKSVQVVIAQSQDKTVPAGDNEQTSTLRFSSHEAGRDE
jgi:signal transduction histidine kinase